MEKYNEQKTKESHQGIWAISKIWNEAIEQKEEKPMVARNRIWASELGKSDIDIYLKLLGTELSNPFDSRAKRKFEAGNLFEWIIKMILIRCGIYNESQKWVGNTEFGLEVSGKIDHLAGGKPKYEEAKKLIEEMELPELFSRATEKILDYFKTEYLNGLPQQGIEVKSTSSFGIEKVYFTGKGLAGHDLQAFHYAYNEKIPFSLLYICRDDLRMAEIPILPDDKELLVKYQNKIKGVTDFYNKKELPPKELEILWEEGTQRFTKNFNIEYSSYLTKIYGFTTPNDYDEKCGSKIDSWNRVMGRIKDGKTLTDKNKIAISEMSDFGVDVLKLLESKI